MKIKVVMKSFFGHICPFIAAALAFVGNPKIFNTLKRRATSIISSLNLVRVPKLLFPYFFRPEQAFA